MTIVGANTSLELPNGSHEHGHQAHAYVAEISVHTCPALLSDQND